MPSPTRAVCFPPFLTQKNTHTPLRHHPSPGSLAGWLTAAGSGWAALGWGLDWVQVFRITSQRVSSGSPDFDLGPMGDQDWLVREISHLLFSTPGRWGLTSLTPHRWNWGIS
ncbi:hypothetical protein, variant [Magnaporthiopsis poae ATCC 64411]|uniref:Uncharacterized protein n=1 Tax=Magnaporthiopsis poae (strain ATCC 64411 / 73-15) TaxID=644358 RepID=A0A0C4DK28_MAGP6|nr:hypothetical protein, variant [Magnaporthiopsis poae ATCC 64411]